MDFTGKLVGTALDFESGKYRLTFEVNEQSALDKGYDEIKDCEKLTVNVEPFKQKRSLEANAYCWTLLHKIAAVTKKKAEDLYREYVKDFGVCEIVPIRKDALDRWHKIWTSKGYGWITEDMGECRTIKGYHNVKCFYGSSSYNTLEMSRLIDAIVMDCKDLGIETATPAEIERMIEIWEKRCGK